jgi:gluconate 2-dehydrogenase gamma chain
MCADHVSRRVFLAAAGAAGAAWLVADPAKLEAALVHARATVLSPPPYRFEGLTPAQAADVEAMMMRIFPSDGTPGAKEAGTIHFADKLFAGAPPAQKSLVVAGLGDLNKRAKAKWPDTTAFSALTPARQDELLKAIEQTPFFGNVRFITIAGMFANSSYGGNQGQVGWKLLGFEGHGIFQAPFGYYDAEYVQKGG